MYLIAAGLTSGISAQKVALKSNLLYDAALSPNLGIEVGLARRLRTRQFLDSQRPQMEALANPARSQILVLPQIRGTFLRVARPRRSIQRRQYRHTGKFSRDRLPQP